MSISAAISAPREFERPAVNPWIIALTVTLATFMEVLDTSVANVALPHIAGGLSAGQDEATWVLTSYLVSNAIVSADERLVFRADRAQTVLHVVRGAVHDQLVSLRFRAFSRRFDFLPCAARRGRWRITAERTGDSG